MLNNNLSNGLLSFACLQLPAAELLAFHFHCSSIVSLLARDKGITSMQSPITYLTLTFVVVSLLYKKLQEYLEFFTKSNIKYKILDYLADYIHYGDDIGIDASLSLDSPCAETLKKRQQGQAYLASKLAPAPSSSSSPRNERGATLSSKLVDCRFALAKVCMPLMRELEFPAQRNFITCVKHRLQSTTKGYANGMYQVDTVTQKELFMVGNDAVHTLGNEAFHAPVQEEINARMSLMEDNGKNSDAMLRFAPLSLNQELEKNVETILNMTGMDKVSGNIGNFILSRSLSLTHIYLSFKL